MHPASQQSATLCLALSGRAWAWPMTARFLKDQTHPHRDIRLRILTTSQDVEFQGMVRSWLAGCDYPEPVFDVVDFGSANLADGNRVENTREVRRVCARIYRHFAEGIETPWVFTLEDDVLPPLDVFPRLLDSIGEDSVSTSALYHGRFVSDPIAWTWDEMQKPVTLAPVQGVQKVGGHGFGAAVFRAAIFQPARFHSEMPHFDFDYNFFHRIVVDEGRTALVDAGLLCRHYVGEDSWVQTPETALQLRRLVGVSTPLSIVHLNAYDHHGGAERVADDLLAGQEKAGHHSVNLVGYKTQLRSKAVVFPIEPDIARRDTLLAGGWPDYQFLGSHRLPSHPLILAADVIHLHNIQGGYFNPLSLIALSQSRPVIWSIHDMHPVTGYCSHALGCGRWQTGCGECPDLTRPGPKLTFDNTAALWSDKKRIADNSRLWVVGGSDWIVNVLRQSLLGGHPICKIPNGIRTDVFRPSNRAEMRAKLGLPKDALIVGSLARLGVLAHPWKGGPHARAVIEALRIDYPNLIFLNLGSNTPGDEPWIRHHVPENDEALRECLGALDFFLFPSIADTAPLSVLEALACGLPVVAFNLGGIPDMVRHGQEGMLAPEGDTAALIEMARTLARDAALRERMGTSARERAVTQFDVSQMVADYEKLYHEAIVAHAGPALPRHTKAATRTLTVSAAPPPEISPEISKLRARLHSRQEKQKAEEIRFRQLLLTRWMKAGCRLGVFGRTLGNWLEKRTSQLFPVHEFPAILTVDEMVAFILRLLDDDWLRHQYSRAIGDGPDGPFARWLEAQLIKKGASAESIRRLIADAYNDVSTRAVIEMFLHLPMIWRLFPTALVERPHDDFAFWMQNQSRGYPVFSANEINWFHQETRENPVMRLVLTYLVNYEWQRLHPHGLEPAGVATFRQWLQSRKWGGNVSDDDLLGAASVAQKAAGRIPGSPAALANSETVGLNLMGHFCYPSGLGESAWQSIRTAHAAGFPTSHRDIPVQQKHYPVSRRDFIGREIYSTTIVQVTPADYYAKIHEHAGLLPMPGIRRIGVCWWELPEIPRGWLFRESWLDELWAPTRFIQENLLQAGLKNIRLALPSVALSPFPTLRRADFGLPEDRLLFLFTFDMRSSPGRKNPLGLIRAFRMAFPHPAERPLLVLKISQGQRDPAALARLQKEAEEAGAVIIDEIMTRERSYALLDIADCYVSLHRSEGFGLGMAESMLLGKPVIGTNYSGNVDFMNAGNSLLVENLGLIEVGNEADSNYHREGLWANPDLEQAAKHLRWVFNHRDEARALGEKARHETRELLSAQAAGIRLRAALSPEG